MFKTATEGSTSARLDIAQGANSKLIISKLINDDKQNQENKIFRVMGEYRAREKTGGKMQKLFILGDKIGDFLHFVSIHFVSETGIFTTLIFDIVFLKPLQGGRQSFELHGCVITAVQNQ